MLVKMRHGTSKALNHVGEALNHVGEALNHVGGSPERIGLAKTLSQMG